MPARLPFSPSSRTRKPERFGLDGAEVGDDVRVGEGERRSVPTVMARRAAASRPRRGISFIATTVPSRWSIARHTAVRALPMASPRRHHHRGARRIEGSSISGRARRAARATGRGRRAATGRGRGAGRRVSAPTKTPTPSARAIGGRRRRRRLHGHRPGGDVRLSSQTRAARPMLRGAIAPPHRRARAMPAAPGDGGRTRPSHLRVGIVGDEAGAPAALSAGKARATVAVADPGSGARRASTRSSFASSSSRPWPAVNFTTGGATVCGARSRPSPRPSRRASSPRGVLPRHDPVLGRRIPESRRVIVSTGGRRDVGVAVPIRPPLARVASLDARRPLRSPRAPTNFAPQFHADHLFTEGRRR